MVELFQTVDHFQIVLEFLEGNDLYDYMDKKNFKISESRAKELVR